MRTLAPAAIRRSGVTPYALRRKASSLVGGQELISLVLLIVVYALWYSDDPRTNFVPLNIAGPAALLVILLLGAWRQVRNNPLSIWAPLFWFRISSGVYFGFGSMVPYIGNDATVAWLRISYDFSEREVFKVDFISLLCIFTVLLTAALISSSWRDHRRPLAAHATKSQSLTFYFAIAMLSIGGYIRYAVLLPLAFGGTDWAPGILVSLGKVYAVGLYLLILYGLRTSRLALGIAGALVLIDVFVGLLTFAKTEVLVTLLFSYLAVLHHRLTLKRMLIGMILIAGIYSKLGPIIAYGRDELERINHISSSGTFEQRLDILTSYTWGEESKAIEGVQLGLARLCYMDFASMVVGWYDEGRPGDSLANVLYVFVPRFIWPDKPVMTAVGSDLYLAATGQEGSSNSTGVFAEAYWNLGWAGIPLLMIPYALILAYLTRYCLLVMVEERWMHLPAVLTAVYMGLRTDGAIVVDVFGAGIIIFAYILICGALEKVLIRNKAGR